MKCRPVASLGLVLLIAGCARPAAAVVAPESATTAVQQTIERFNATAGGPVATQEARLASLVSVGQASVQSRCPPAHSTISFEPVYARLTASPEWTPTSGTLPGAVYSLPTLIRVYTGDRITSTDLTDLHVSIQGERSWLPALCLS